MSGLRQVFEFRGDDEIIKTNVDWESVEENVNLSSGDAITKRCREIIAETATAIFDDEVGPDDIIRIFNNPTPVNDREISKIIHKMLGIIYFKLFKHSNNFPSLTYVINRESLDAIPGEPIIFSEERNQESGAKIKTIVNGGNILASLLVEPTTEAFLDNADQRIARAVLKNNSERNALDLELLYPLVKLRLICEHAMIHFHQIINGGVVASTQSMFCHNATTTFIAHTSADFNSMLSSQIRFLLTQDDRSPTYMLHRINK